MLITVYTSGMCVLVPVVSLNTPLVGKAANVAAQNQNILKRH